MATCLLLANCGLMLLHRVAYLQGKNLAKGVKNTKKPLLVRVMTPDNLHFGGMQMKSCRLWTIVTASFEHASGAHLVNNMIHFLGFASALESIIGGVNMI